MIGRTLEDCVRMTQAIYKTLNKYGFDAPEKVIVALYLEEATKAECREIEQLERMVHSE